jgi:hypothetical protein
MRFPLTSVALSPRVAGLAFVVVSLVRVASAETTIAQWNFNDRTSAETFRQPTSGTITTGSAYGFGQNSSTAPFSSILETGSPIDPGTVLSGTTYNLSYVTNTPLASDANGTIGVGFFTPTTGMTTGFERVMISWSQTVGFRSSRYWQLLVSTSGTAGPFSAPTGGVGSSITQFVTGYNSGTSAISGTATVNVSNTGLIDFRTIDGNWLNHAVTTATNSLPSPLVAGFVDNISYTLPLGQGFENNANFAFAIVGLWDPSLSATSGTTGLVSSFAGTNSADTINGYSRSVASGGSMRIDMMTVSAVPEPSTLALVGAAALIGGSAEWRRRRRRRRRVA